MKRKLIPLMALSLFGVLATSCGGQSYTNTKDGVFDLKTALADGELAYAILVGEDGNPEAIDRTNGCVEAMNTIAKAGNFTAKELERKTCINETGSWNDQVAKETVEGWTKKYGQRLDFIVSNNDGMAVAAANSQGLTTKLPIVGFDALSSACDMVKSGKLAGSVSQNGDDQALTTLTVLGNLIKGEADVTKGYAGKAELDKGSIDKHIIQTKLSAVTAANADSFKPGAYVNVTEDTALKGKKILVAYYSQNDNFISETFMKALPHYAEKLGFSVTEVSVTTGEDADLLNQVKTAAQKDKFDAFALNIITHANYEKYLEVAAGAPTVFFNRQPKKSDDSGVADLSTKEKVYFVGSSSVGQGAVQGKVITDWYNANK